MSTDWIQNYNRINNSFKKTLVFKFGDSAGFFSEYNCTISAIIYCLQHKIKFVLTSQQGIFTIDQGWQDYFLPFVEEDNRPFHKQLNTRARKRWNLLRQLQIFIVKKRTGITYFTQDVFQDVLAMQTTRGQSFSFPELGIINQDYFQTAQVIVNALWKLSPAFDLMCRQLATDLQLPNNYISIHIRKGDKIIEVSLVGTVSMMDAALPYATRCNKNAFVLTDHYGVIEELRELYPDWNFITNCRADERGYFHQNLIKQDKTFLFKENAKLIVAINACIHSKKFIGTHSSNIGLFMSTYCGINFCDFVEKIDFYTFMENYFRSLKKKP